MIATNVCTPILIVVAPLQESDVYTFAVIGWILVSHGDTFYARNFGQHYIATVQMSMSAANPVIVVARNAGRSDNSTVAM